MSIEVDISVNGVKNNEVRLAALGDSEKWEGKVSFTPETIGKSQKVEFLLLRNGEDEPYHSLHLWIDVRQE